MQDARQGGGQADGPYDRQGDGSYGTPHEAHREGQPDSRAEPQPESQGEAQDQPRPEPQPQGETRGETQGETRGAAQAVPAVAAGALPRRSAGTWLRTLLGDLVALLARRPVALAGASHAIRHSADARQAIYLVMAADLVSSVVVDAMIPAAYRLLHVAWVLCSLVLTAGCCAMTARAPHLIDADTLHLRTGPFRTLAVPLAHIASVRPAHGLTPSHGLRRSLDRPDAVACSVSSATTMAVELAEPLSVRFRRGEPVLARHVYFAADQPAEAARLIRNALPTAEPR
ncbi:hypothetical protein ACMA1D_19705 [Streptomyces sp. 796.1]|uniref:hypothetical protein n=1 Tax=Streptomyces sp. 796.1 TaxID=3163029 RepID=UPI0039C99B08